MMGLHFVWVYPTQHQGAAIFRMHRNSYKSKIYKPLIVLGAWMEVGSHIQLVFSFFLQHYDFLMTLLVLHCCMLGD
jgi:hypothetical protein